ncbi:MAG: deoxyribodipyrimidine photo-lyase [Herminiimonas sp.]|nr:deoxyribodipyrimidine photo-lyase [Herminiimonas sp.]
MQRYDKTLVWFRRDLRSFDHAALHHALLASRQVYCAFIYDRDILDELPRADRRVEFIHASITELASDLERLGGALIVRHAVASTEIVALAQELGVDAVFANRDYEPQAIARDAAVATALQAAGRHFESFKDQVIFERDEVLSLAAKTFTVFTPYKNAWLRKLQATPDAADQDFYVRSYPVEAHRESFAVPPPAIARALPTLQELGFEPTNLSRLPIPTGMSGGARLFDEFLPRMPGYRDTRDYPAIKGPSYLSVHLRFGTVSVRALVRRAVEAMRSGEGSATALPKDASLAQSGAAGDGASDAGAGVSASASTAGVSTWLSELIWRDFYFMILHQNPHVAGNAFKPEYERIEFETGAEADALFAGWCEGRTGYPLVDAAMAQINQTGYMHNRLRMVTACFLIKDLGIDWRRGEAYFAQHLNDYDLSANNGGWQWAASSGCDAQPYFRIFNPITQSEKFDGEGKFIRRYLPQLDGLGPKQIHAPWLQAPAVLAKAGIVLGTTYPRPVVEHDAARKKTLERYAVVKKIASAA